MGCAEVSPLSHCGYFEYTNYTLISNYNLLKDHAMYFRPSAYTCLSVMYFIIFSLMK